MLLHARPELQWLELQARGSAYAWQYHGVLISKSERYGFLLGSSMATFKSLF